MTVKSKYTVVATILYSVISGTLTSLVYDSYSGWPITEEEHLEHIKRNTTFWCVNEIYPCDPNEGRRIDASCNNLKHPSRGASHTPGYHVLPVTFDGYDEPRKSFSGEELPLSRRVRTTLLAEGRIPDQQVTQLVTYFWVFMSADVLSFHDTVNYLVRKVHCCSEQGKADPVCVNIKIPDDDPIHRFTSERCFNLTRPMTFQSTGCTSYHHPPERTVTSTSLFDLSHIYGENSNILHRSKRLSHGGLLKYEIVDGRIWPLTLRNFQAVCIANQPPRETRCHDIGEESNNGILGTNLFTIWMWRYHNYVANELARINPCWDDDKLFYTTREIIIAMIMQIFLYEFHPILFGEENLIKEGVLSPSLGYRDIYKEDVIPQVSLEFGFALRWAHTIQEGEAKMYDTNGNYLKSMRIANLTLRTGYLAIDNNIDYITQGAFRQAGGKIDKVIDPDLAETLLGPMQRVADAASSDLSKNRYLGIAPYVQYRQFCFGKIINTFEDLKDAIDPEYIVLLQELYQDVKDIDLMAGIWVEKAIPNGRVPATFYCLMVEQLRRSIISDRHWYERENRPNAFTIDQLLEIRKASIARILCDAADKVSEIQPHAFLIPGPGNVIVSCDEITRIDLNEWTDGQC